MGIWEYLLKCDKMTPKLSYQVPQSDRQPYIPSFILLSGEFLSVFLSVFLNSSSLFFALFFSFSICTIEINIISRSVLFYPEFLLVLF